MIDRLNLLLPRRLGLACLLIAGVNVLELIWARIDPVPEASSIIPASANPGGIAPMTLVHFPASAQFDEISTRPVFAPSRQPTPDIDNQENAATAISAPNLTITGIAGTGDRRYFVVRREASPRLAPMRVGDEIEGWRVAAIAADDVTLTNGITTAHYGIGDAAPVVAEGSGSGFATRAPPSEQIPPSGFSTRGFSLLGRRYPAAPPRADFHGFGWGIP